jgi:hypothetical protein
MIMRCESNHTKINSRRLVLLDQLPRIEDDEIPFPEYKLPNDLSHALPAAEDDTPFPEYDSPDLDDELPFLQYNTPNDANLQKNEFRMQFTIQQKDYTAWDNESCGAMRASFVPTLDTIVKYDCPEISRNTLWVTLAMVTLSGGSMFQICLWIIFTRRSTMRQMAPVPDQLPFYVHQEPVSAYAGYHDPGGSSSTARARRAARLQAVYKKPADSVPATTKSGGRRRK